MSDELRWILLGLGALLIVGLWLWESIRARRRPLLDESAAAPAVRQPVAEPKAGWQEPVWSAPEPGSFEMPEIDLPDEAGLPPLDPPIIEMTDDLDMTLDRDLPLVTPAPSTFDRPRAPAVAPPPAPAPPVVETPPAPLPEPKPAAPRPAPPRQKILALRLVGTSSSGRFAGSLLRSSLEAEGLAFGRYHIFHRELDDRQLLFSVASLIEPGSFALETMATQDFPGISLFAVLPGSLPATQVFDEMVAAARRLTARLGGQLQDDRRLPLTASRILEMRDEMEAFDLALGAGEDAGGG